MPEVSTETRIKRVKEVTISRSEDEMITPDQPYKQQAIDITTEDGLRTLIILEGREFEIKKEG